MDPELAEVAATLPEADQRLADDPAGIRAAIRELTLMAPPSPHRDRLRIHDRSVPGPPGAPDVGVRVYRPRETPGTLPGVVYLHGGAFVIGDLDAAEVTCARLAAEVGCVVVSVDYRLAPEHPFPAGVEDCYAAVAWTAGAAGELGIDAGRLAVAGASAGGGLAAAVALMARDRGWPALVFQLLIYPALDDRLTGQSVGEATDPALFDGVAAAEMWQLYLQGAPATSPYAAPARAEDLTGLPPAYVLTAELDPLRDEGIDYAVRLQRSGVPTELHHFAGAYHAFDTIAPAAAISQRAITDYLAAVRAALGTHDQQDHQGG